MRGGQWLKSIRFKLPIIENDLSIGLDNGEHVKTVVILSFVDAYRTLWIQGKSYLCRLIDAMNSGIVDEVIVGQEVLTRWLELLRSIIEN